MNAEEATEIMRTVIDRFPEKARDAKLQFALHGALCALQVGYAVAAQAVAGLISDPKAKFPTPQEIRAAIAKADRPGKFDECERQARALLDKHGRDLLSIRARRAAEPCEWCETHAVAHGVSPDDTLLYHEHFKASEYDAEPALAIAINMAQYGDWSRKQADYPYDALRARYTRQPSQDDSDMLRIGNKRRFATLRDAVTPKKPSRRGRGMDAVADLKNEGQS